MASPPVPSSTPALARTLLTRPQRITLPAVATRQSLQRKMTHVGDLSAPLVERLWTDTDEVVASGTMLKDGDRCTVVRLDSPAAAGDDSSRQLTLKRYNLKSTLHTAMHMPLRSRARWSWLNGRKLIKTGVATPMPLVCLEERRAGVLHLRSYLLSEFIPGRSLLDLIKSADAKADQLADLALQFSRIWQMLGHMRAGHGDMKATNFIVDPRGKLWLIDLDGLRIHHSALLLRRERRIDITRFMRNWQEHPEVAAIFRARIGTG